MYSQIVVPLDGSPMSARAIQPGLALAGACQSPLVALTCVWRGETASERAEVVRAQLEAAGAGEAELRVEPVQGPVAPAIAAVVEDQPGSLVVMASVARPRTAPIVGSVSEEVLASLSQPVLLVGPHADVTGFSPTGTMVVPVDGSRTSESILPLAAAWSLAFGLEPWVVMVVDRSATDALAAAAARGGDVGVETGYVHRMAERIRQSTEHPVEFEVLHGSNPARQVADFARDNKAAVVAVSTHGRTGVQRVALGSVAIAIVHHAPCPVLVHRPPHLPRL
jgi:nucleotide-binding universal stress UspA family protein